MSHLLISLFIEDLELILQNTPASCLQKDDIVIIMLLFAEDMAIISKMQDEIHKYLDDFRISH